VTGQYPPSKTKPWKHQEEAWALSKDHKSFYFANDMGTGKSKAAIDYANGHNVNSILIVCPKTVIPVWPFQFEIHSYKTYEIFAPMNGESVPKKAEACQSFIKSCKNEGKPYVIILNYEAFFKPPLGPIIAKNYKLKHPGLLMGLKWDLMICDEIHRIKSPRGKQSWAATKIGSAAERKLGLSGTPMPHSPIDIYAQYRFLDKQIFGPSFQQFRVEYCVMGGYEGRQVIGYINQPDLHKKFYSIAHRVKASDVLDLPDHMHEVIPITMSTKAMKIYKQLEEDFITWINEEEVTVDNALVKLLRLAQFTSGFYQAKADGPTKNIDDTKIKAMIDIISDLPLTEPIVIFCRFRHELAIIWKEMQKLGRTVGEISGRENDYPAWKRLEFNTLAVQIRSGGVGIDLTEACYVFYMSTGHSAGDFMQSAARVLRPGQERPVKYYHFHAKATVDVSIYRAIRKRIKIVEELMEGPDKNKPTNNNTSLLNDIYSAMTNTEDIPF